MKGHGKHQMEKENERIEEQKINEKHRKTIFAGENPEGEIL